MKSNHDHLSQSDIAEELGVSTRHSFVAGPFKAISAAMAKGEVSGEVVVAGKSVAWKVDGQRPVVPQSSLEAFKAQATLKPKADPNYLNRDQVAAQLGVPRAHATLKTVWSAIRDQMAEGKEAGTITLGNDHIEWKIFYSERNLKLPYVHTGGLDRLRSGIEQEPKKASGEELSISRICTLLSITATNTTIKSLVHEIDSSIARGERSGTAKIGNIEVPWTLLKSIWGGSSKYGGLTAHIPSFAVPSIAKVAGVQMPAASGTFHNRKVELNSVTRTVSEQRSEASATFIQNTGNPDIEVNPYLTRWDVSKALGVTPRHSVVHSIFSKLDAAVKSGEKQGVIDIDGQNVPWTLHKRPHGGSPAPTLPGIILQKLYASMPIFRKSNTDYLSREEAAAELGVPIGSPILLKAWTLMRLQAEEGHEHGTIALDGEFVNWRLLTSKTNGQFPYMERSSLEAIKKAATRSVDTTLPNTFPTP